MILFFDIIYYVIIETLETTMIWIDFFSNMVDKNTAIIRNVVLIK
jgi:hypothetical protein